MSGDNSHGRATDLLHAQLERGVLPHAHLFVGPEGVGRVEAARALAGAILCGENADGPCGVCSGCRALARGEHPDYHEFATPEGRRQLPIDTIRELQDEASRKPHVGSMRVFVIREAEQMTIEAANCFLKTLEEPPGECYLILIATGLRDMPETIVSRCQVTKFTGISPEETARRLDEEGIDEGDLAWLSLRSWGSPGRAKKFCRQRLHEFNQRLIDKVIAMRPQDNLTMSDFLQKSAKHLGDNPSERRLAAQELLECLAMIYHDAAALMLEPDAIVFNQHRREDLTRFGSGRELDSMIECADSTLDALERIGANANQRLVFDDLFSSLAFSE